MHPKDNLTMLLTGIGLLLIPLIVLSTNTIEGTWIRLDTEWRWIVGTLLLFGFAFWAIWDALTASPPTPK